MPPLKVALVQFDIAWENPVANMATLEEMLEDIGTVDLIVLPEMFNTGFSMNPKKIAESANMQTHKWMQQMAKRKNAVILGSIALFEKGDFYNAALAVWPEGETKTYFKKHLFSLAGEQNHYSAGNSKTILEINGWKIAPFICYDLRFPVWSRNTGYQYDVAIYVANWPQQRQKAWDSLLVARAIENQSYVIGCNRVGIDANDNRYLGNSAIIDYLGETIMSKSGESAILIEEFNKEKLLELRTQFPFLNDADAFNLT